MKSNTLFLIAFILLATGVWLIFGYCNGSAGFNDSVSDDFHHWYAPISGFSLQIAITTKGFPALGGLLLTILGSILMFIRVIVAFIAIVMALATRSRRPKAPESAGHA